MSNIDARYNYHPAPTVKNIEAVSQNASSGAQLVVDKNGQVSSRAPSLAGHFFKAIIGGRSHNERLENQRTAQACNEALTKEFPGLKNHFKLFPLDKPVTSASFNAALLTAKTLKAKEIVKEEQPYNSNSFAAREKSPSPTTISETWYQQPPQAKQETVDHKLSETREEKRLLRNEFKKVAAWAKAIHQEATTDLDSARTAIKWAQKNNPETVPKLETWANVAKERQQATEKYASWAEARHQASVAKEWDGPYLNASQDVADGWSHQHPHQDRITSTTSLQQDKEILTSRTRAGITQNWTSKEINTNWEAAKKEPWVTVDSQYDEIKKSATEFAVLQRKEEEQKQHSTKMREIFDRENKKPVRFFS